MVSRRYRRFSSKNQCNILDVYQYSLIFLENVERLERSEAVNSSEFSRLLLDLLHHVEVYFTVLMIIIDGSQNNHGIYGSSSDSMLLGRLSRLKKDPATDS